MKTSIRTLFSIFLVFLLAQTCFAKDSTLVFKISAGVNFGYLNAPETYYYPWDAQGGYGSQNLTIGDESALSPMIKAGAQKMFGKHVGILLQLSYHCGKLTYREAVSSVSFSNAANPGAGTIIARNITADNRILSNNFTLSLGPVFYIRHLYISPKADISMTLDITKTDSTYKTFVQPAGTSDQRESAMKTQESAFTAGGGLIIGYDFKIRKHILFVELQASYYNSIFGTSGLPGPYRATGSYSSTYSYDAETLSNFRGSFTIGIGF